MTEKRPVSPLGDLIRDVLVNLESRRLDSRDDLFVKAWAAVAGRELATRSRVQRFAKGVVHIEVDSPPLCAELTQFRAEPLLEGLRAAIGPDVPVKQIKFRLGTF